MAKIPAVKSIRIEDISPEAPSWVNNLLSPLNSFMETIYSALIKNITFNDNIACMIKDIDFRTPSDYTSANNFETINITNTLKTTAQGLFIMQLYNNSDQYSKIVSAVTPFWLDDNGIIKIQYISGLSNSINYKGKVLII